MSSLFCSRILEEKGNTENIIKKMKLNSIDKKALIEWVSEVSEREREMEKV